MSLENRSKSTRPGDELPVDKLNAWCIQERITQKELKSVRQFGGGYSNLTYEIQTEEEAYILRKPPKGAEKIKGGHDMAREYRVLKALEKASFPFIPSPIALCEDKEVLGVPFYVMKKVDGIIYRAEQVNYLQENLSEIPFQTMSLALCDALVALHSVNIHETGLIDLGKPDGYVTRQVEGWTKRYLAAQTSSIPSFNFVNDWLLGHIPISGIPTLIHNDFKYDNVVFAAAGSAEVKAILDWEMTTVGDPLMDVGTALSYWSEENDGPFEKSFNVTWLPGNCTRADFVARYAQKSGRYLDGILFYYVFGLFKNAVVIQQIFARYKAGLSTDSRFAHLDKGVERLLQKAQKSIETGKMC
jgi:aminoglycoside phosphotransferase (APT) family kinase protein